MPDDVSLLPTYVDGLDKTLGGGIPRGSVILVAGTPGTMKTSLVFNIMSRNACNGSKGLYITLEQSVDSLRMSMSKIGLTAPDESHLYILDVARLRLELQKAEASKDWMRILVELIKEAVNTDNYDMVALDSLEALYAIANFESPRRELFHLFGALKEMNLTSFLIAETPFGENKLTEFGEDFLADGIISLRQVEVGETDVQLRLRVVKMRMMNHEHGYLALLHDGNNFAVTNVIGRKKKEENRFP